MRYWVGVASRDHVLLGVAGGFCQVCHGKQAPLARMKQGDWILYYSPKTGMNSGEKVQAFTAVGADCGRPSLPVPHGRKF